MRRMVFSSLAILTILSTGCNFFKMGLISPGKVSPPEGQVPTKPPTVDALVNYMNDNSKLMTTLRCPNMDIHASQDGKLLAFRLDGRMMARQPRSMFLRAEGMGKTQVELGSNDEEFWYWNRQDKPEPVQIHCDYKTVDEGRVQADFLPFRPDWVMETIGMGQYGPAEKYQLKVYTRTLKLIEKTKSPQGKPVTKVIVFNRYKANAPTPQVTDYLLIDDTTGKEICSAKVHSVQVDKRAKGQYAATFPREMTIRWNKERVNLKLHIRSPEVNVNIPANALAFRRQPKGKSFDLALGRFDDVPTSSGIRQTSSRGRGFGLFR
ncbi:MAG: hypothetical protein ACFCD0_05045 [Gemmataceae bacterium]